MTGWSNWLSQITAAPSVNYGTASMILAAASINSGGTYVPTNWQIYLTTASLMLIHGCISSLPTRLIARFNACGSTFNMIALVIVIIMIPAATNRQSQGLPKFNSAADVWGGFHYSEQNRHRSLANANTIQVLSITVLNFQLPFVFLCPSWASSGPAQAMILRFISRKNAVMPILQHHAQLS